MGQYYYPIILDAEGNIVVWMDAQMYNNGLKLTEHAYLTNSFVNTFEYSLTPEGIYHKSRVVWAGDYADNEPEQDKNLFTMCNEYNVISPRQKETVKYQFVVNHTKKQYVDKLKGPTEDGSTLHVLPLLTVEGNGRGGGDYHTKSPLVGSWARDVISVEETAPPDFTEVVFDV